MILVALLFSVLCHGQSNEKHVSALEERIATLEAYVLEIVSLAKKDSAATNTTIKTINTIIKKITKTINSNNEAMKVLNTIIKPLKYTAYGAMGVTSTIGFLVLYDLYHWVQKK